MHFFPAGSQNKSLKAQRVRFFRNFFPHCEPFRVQGFAQGHFKPVDIWSRELNQQPFGHQFTARATKWASCAYICIHVCIHILCFFLYELFSCTFSRNPSSHCEQVQWPPSLGLINRLTVTQFLLCFLTIRRYQIWHAGPLRYSRTVSVFTCVTLIYFMLLNRWINK